jgi:hypothetical protein
MITFLSPSVTIELRIDAPEVVDAGPAPLFGSLSTEESRDAENIPAGLDFLTEKSKEKSGRLILD